MVSATLISVTVLALLAISLQGADCSPWWGGSSYGFSRSVDGVIAGVARDAGGAKAKVTKDARKAADRQCASQLVTAANADLDRVVAEAKACGNRLRESYAAAAQTWTPDTRWLIIQQHYQQLGDCKDTARSAIKGSRRDFSQNIVGCGRR